MSLSTTTPKVDGVQFQNKANGRVYAYHRKTRQRIRAEYGTPEFQAELDALNGLVRPADRPTAGTLAALFDKYRRSPEFIGLAPRTRKDYEKVFDYLRPGAKDQVLATFVTRHILVIRNAVNDKKGRHFANYCVTVIRLVFNWAVSNNELPRNPIAGATKLKIRRPHGMPKANRRWAPFECEAVLAEATGGVKVAIALGMFAGMREGDALAAARLNYFGSHVMWMQQKTGSPVRLPVDSRLHAIIEESLAGRDPVDAASQLVINKNGVPYTPDGFRTMLWKLIHRLETEGKVLPGLTFHGLRHTAATTLAELGASTGEIKAMLGHKSDAMAALYAQEAEQGRLGARAIERLRRHAAGEASDG